MATLVYPTHLPQSFPRQRGASLLVFVIFGILLLGLVGFAVDLAMLSTSRAQLQHAGEQASLAAIKAFVDSEKVDLGDRFIDARNRASFILGQNMTRLVATPYFKDPNDPQNVISLVSNAIPPDPQSVSGNGYLLPGFYYFARPDCLDAQHSNSCACAVNANNFEPCFEPVNLGNPAINPNALRLHARTSPSSPIRTLFAKFLGIEEVAISVSSTAAQIPRNGVFLMDLSRSVVSQTFGPPIQYALGPKDFGTCPQNGVFEPSLFQEQTGDSLVAQIIETGQVMVQGDPITSNDYQCLSGDPANEDLNVNDHFIFTAGAPEPEPLNSILEGVHVALRQFAARAVASDRVGIIGFDDQVLRSRTTLDNRGPSAVTAMIQPDPGVAEFQSYLQATQTRAGNFAGVPYNALNINQRLDLDADGDLDLMLFPRSLSAAPKVCSLDSFVNFDQSFEDFPDGPDLLDWQNGEEVWNPNEAQLPSTPLTDIPSAVGNALNLIRQQDGFLSAENFIVLFSDGLTLCTDQYGQAGSDSCTTEGAPIVDHYQPIYWNPGQNPPVGLPAEGLYWGRAQIRGRCVQHGAYYQASMQLLNGLAPQLANGDVALHVVLFGDNVSPHTVVRSNGPNAGCMTDDQHRRSTESYQYTLWNEPDCTTDIYGFCVDRNGTFFGPNRLWQFANQTGGKWIPIRPPCPAGAEAVLDAACSSKDRGAIFDSASFSNTVLSNFVDNSSRLTCDPQERGTGDQIVDAMNEIMGRNPFTLVYDAGGN